MGSNSFLKISLVAFLFYSILLAFSQLPRIGPQSLRNPRILEIIAGQKAQYSFNFLVLTFIALLLFQTFYKGIKDYGFKFFAPNETKMLYLLIAAGTLTQLYPYVDEYHIAFIVPVVIVAATFTLTQGAELRRQQTAFRYLSLALIPILAMHFFILASVERTEFTSRTLAGMYGSWQSAKSLDLTMIKLENESPGIKFECKDGIYAGAGGRYLSSDEKFVAWGPPLREKGVVSRKFMCFADNQLISSYLEQDWQVKFKVLLSPVTDVSNDSYWNVLFEKFELVPDKEAVR